LAYYIEKGITTMSLGDNKALVRQVIEYWNQRDLQAFFNVLAHEYVEHLPIGDVSLEHLKKYAHTFFTTFPDIQITLKYIVAERDKVAVLVNWKATHCGENVGIPATGKKIDIAVAFLVKIVANKWVEFWNVTDVGLIKQLGKMPEY
jgi:predicted ester cyclase